MAVQDDIANMLAQIASAKDALNSVAGQATGAIAQVTAAYTARISGLTMSLWVNAITGADANPGTAQLPLRSLQAAIDKCPMGGFLDIYLQADFTTSSKVLIKQKFVRIQSSGANVFRLGLGPYIETSLTPNGRSLNGFRFSGNAALILWNVTLAIPSVSGYTSYTAYGEECAFGPQFAVDGGTQQITLYNCRLDVPNSPFGALIMPSWCVGLSIQIATMVGESTSLNGKVVKDVTNAAGTSASNYPNLLTTMTTI